VKVADYLKRWFDKKVTTLAPNTAEGLASILKRWKAIIGERPAAELSTADVEQVEMAAVALGRSASHLNKEKTYFGAFLKYLDVCGIHHRAHIEVWQRRRVTVKKKYICLTRPQEESLVKASPEWLGRFIKFAISTGLREGTIRKLRWDQIDPEGVLTIPPDSMKARRPHRLHISGKAFAALGPTSEGLLFPELPDSRRLYYLFKKAVKQAAGVPPECGPHDLRRSFVGRMLEAGCPTATLLQLGGWSETSTLIKHYMTEAVGNSGKQYLEKI